MIVRILGVITGLFFAVTSAAMMYIGQDGMFAQISIFIVGCIFTAYGFMGPKRMGSFFPAMVKEIGGEIQQDGPNGNEK